MSKQRRSLSNRTDGILTVILAIATLISLFGLLFSLRNAYLCCHDSMTNFVDARKNSIPDFYRLNFTYSLHRGKITVLFPLVATFRDIVMSTGDYLNLWLLQYVPIVAVVALISFILGKKTTVNIGLSFSLFFTTFLQVDCWHSLIVCYPLDFMYGLFMAILGVWFFVTFLNRKSRGLKSRFIWLVLSLICYYASLATYEAFITLSIIYALLAFLHCLKCDKKFKTFVIDLLPHAIVGVIYLVLVLLLSRKYQVGTGSEAYGMFNGSPEDALRTWYGFSTSMFPLKQFDVVNGQNVIRDYAFLSKSRVIITVGATVGSLVSSVIIFRQGRVMEEARKKNICNKLLTIGASGLILGSTFALPHSLSSHYQEWFIDGNALGYVPSTICYFGWMIMLVCALAFLLLKLSRLPKPLTATIAIVICFVTLCGSAMTNTSNQTFWGATTGVTLKARTFRDYFMSDDFRQKDYRLVCCPDFIGLHFNFATNEAYIKQETGREDIALINDLDQFASVAMQYQNPMLFRYNAEDSVAMIIPIVSEENGVLYSNSVSFYSVLGGNFRFSLINGDESSVIELTLVPGVIATYECEMSNVMDFTVVVN